MAVAVALDNQTLAQRLDPYLDGAEKITVQDLQQGLAASKGSQIVTIGSLTTPDHYKTYNGDRRHRWEYADNILKLARTNVIVNWNYADAVRRQRVREGRPADFEPLPRKWGTRLRGTPFVAHVIQKTGELRLYIEAKIEAVLHVEYFNNDGEPLDAAIVEPWLKPEYPNMNQNLDDEVVLRDFTITNIVYIVVKGRGYVIEG